ncbi:MAG: hypothetical protein IJL53_08895 [Firmicutes bacterium]|nr:hypothetical protein [Bacillota bacterium]
MNLEQLVRQTLYEPLAAAALLLLTMQMALVLASLRDRRSTRIKLLYSVHFSLTFVLIYLPFLILIWKNYKAYTYRSEFLSDLVSRYGETVPASAIALYEAISILIVIAAFREYHAYRKKHLTADSIKETMDLLPAGIAIAQPEGTVVLFNRTMNNLARRLTGKRLSDINVFREAAGGTHTTGSNSSFQLTLPDGAGVWQISSEELETNGENYTQVTASDITHQAAITAELAEMNEKLRDINMRLSIYNRQADRMIVAQEMLTARMAVHNEVGSMLLEIRHYLKNPASIDEELLLQAVRNTNTYLLREYEEDDTEVDPLTESIEMAKVIGVEVVISGIIPSAEPYRGILASAISEAATNTVKHADGNRLAVSITEEKGTVAFILKSNGRKPDGPVREGGGLMSLRNLVEKHGGMMRTETGPEMQLIIELGNINGSVL